MPININIGTGWEKLLDAMRAYEEPLYRRKQLAQRESEFARSFGLEERRQEFYESTEGRRLAMELQKLNSDLETAESERERSRAQTKLANLKTEIEEIKKEYADEQTRLELDYLEQQIAESEAREGMYERSPAESSTAKEFTEARTNFGLAVKSNKEDLLTAFNTSNGNYDQFIETAGTVATLREMVLGEENFNKLWLMTHGRNATKETKDQGRALFDMWSEAISKRDAFTTLGLNTLGYDPALFGVPENPPVLFNAETTQAVPEPSTPGQVASDVGKKFLMNAPIPGGYGLSPKQIVGGVQKVGQGIKDVFGGEKTQGPQEGSAASPQGQIVHVNKSRYVVTKNGEIYREADGRKITDPDLHDMVMDQLQKDMEKQVQQGPQQAGFSSMFKSPSKSPLSGGGR